MHYYYFHIGDYASHTRHLTLIEDIAYRRLLDLYYMNEKPIAADHAARLIGMREHGHDVLAVLIEFFTETEEGFINKRADEEIAKFYESQSERESEKENERERQKRHREERKALFSKLRDIGVAPEYNTPTQQLRHMLNNGDVTVTYEEHTTDATAIHKPITNNHKPINKYSPSAHLVSLGVSEQVASDFIALRKSKKAQLTETAINGIKREADKAGWSMDSAISRCCERGWQAFKADWVKDDKPETPKDSGDVTLPNGQVVNRATYEMMRRFA